MAAVHYSPLSTALEDPVTYKEASALLADTGHPASPGTVARWVKEARQAGQDIPVTRSGRTDQVSWSIVARLHRDRTAVKLRASAAW
ncbi:hypothetical protein [Streptomyces cylindrosporus]|uniref:Transposase n=1 Tax=Streptomyces cylindrosporus TaxID=2927583 RepID=A0ABS9YPH2_9ACTN|nr:hypothetical protein [Streptomyces cylindrosporus]MCI3279173.1 hypothetical protein [Streptomyces cylindrosporus]